MAAKPEKGEPAVKQAAASATIHRLPLAQGRRVVSTREGDEHYRDHVGDLCERTVAIVLGVPLASLRRKTRSTADIALARQVAMYLCHTTFSLLLTEVGLHFNRDRTTVAHACALIEEKRDDMAFDTTICQLEAVLMEARAAMGHCYTLGCSGHDLSNHFPDSKNRGEAV
ncbi:MAG: helix-turn-helix domain-containing protein [Pseudomonadota bacterium]